MPAPSTVVTLVDADGDEFPVRLPGVYRSNGAADAEAALQLAKDEVAHGNFTPRGDLAFARIEYQNESA